MNFRHILCIALIVVGVAPAMAQPDEFTSPQVPNSFTPNGDEVNDLFTIEGSFSEFHITIFNRWGEKIFQSDDAEFAWDGTLQGKPQPVGVYVWKLTGKAVTGEEFDHTGNVTLMR